MSRARILFLVALATILGLWRLFELEGVADAFWNFVTAGAIPGTHAVLEPLVTIKLMLGLFAVTIFIVFRKEFLAALPNRRRYGKTTKPIPVHPLTPAVSVKTSTPAKPKVIVTIPRRAKKRPEGQSLWLRLLGMTAVRMLVAGSRLREILAGVYIAMSPRIRAVWHSLQRYVQTVFYWVINTAKHSWSIVKPYLHTLDEWLEDSLRQNKKTTKAVELFDEITKIGAAILREVWVHIRKVGRCIHSFRA